MRGKAQKVTEPNIRNEAIESSSYEPADRYILFQLFIEEAGSTIYKDGKPSYIRWKE